jgi:hypothetical protein
METIGQGAQYIYNAYGKSKLSDTRIKVLKERIEAHKQLLATLQSSLSTKEEAISVIVGVLAYLEEQENFIGVSSSTETVPKDLQELGHRLYEESSKRPAREIPKVSERVYAILSDHSYNCHLPHSLSDSWHKLCHYTPRDYDYGFHAAAYVNFDLKHVIISHRGTDNIKNMLANLTAFTQQHPADICYEALQFADSVISLMNGGLGDAGGYTFSVTGHSLGGTLAEVVAIIMNIPCTTFECPGSYTIIEKIMGSEFMEKIDSRKSDIVRYTAAPNHINTALKQIPGQHYILNINPDGFYSSIETLMPVVTSILTNSNWFGNNFTSYSKKFVSNYWEPYLAPAVSDVNYTLKYHGIANMVQFFENNKGKAIRRKVEYENWPCSTDLSTGKLQFDTMEETFQY